MLISLFYFLWIMIVKVCQTKYSINSKINDVVNHFTQNLRKCLFKRQRIILLLKCIYHPFIQYFILLKIQIKKYFVDVNASYIN